MDGANAGKCSVCHAAVHRACCWSGLFRLIDSIKAFPLIYLLTDGGPGT